MIKPNLVCEEKKIAIARKGPQKNTVHTNRPETCPFFPHANKIEFDHKIMHGSRT